MQQQYRAAVLVEQHGNVGMRRALRHLCATAWVCARWSTAAGVGGAHESSARQLAVSQPQRALRILDLPKEDQSKDTESCKLLDVSSDQVCAHGIVDRGFSHRVRSWMLRCSFCKGALLKRSTISAYLAVGESRWCSHYGDRGKAAEAFKTALQLDPFSLEAFEQLTDGHLLRVSDCAFA